RPQVDGTRPPRGAAQERRGITPPAGAVPLVNCGLFRLVIVPLMLAMLAMRMVVCMIVGVAVRTGRMLGHSAAGLAVVAAAVLAQRHAAPQVARQLAELLRQRHRLVQIGEKVAVRGPVAHSVLLEPSSQHASGLPLRWRRSSGTSPSP